MFSHVCIWRLALSGVFCFWWRQMAIKVIKRISNFPSWWLMRCWKQPNVSNWRHNSRTVIRTSYLDERFSCKDANHIPSCCCTNAVCNPSVPPLLLPAPKKGGGGKKVCKCYKGFGYDLNFLQNPSNPCYANPYRFVLSSLAMILT